MGNLEFCSDIFPTTDFALLWLPSTKISGKRVTATTPICFFVFFFFCAPGEGGAEQRQDSAKAAFNCMLQKRAQKDKNVSMSQSGKPQIVLHRALKN